MKVIDFIEQELCEIKNSNNSYYEIDVDEEYIKNMENVYKYVKAIEIIKNKSVNVRNLIIYCFEMNDTYEEYVDVFNYCYNYWELGKELLTEEEYNLLKEIL